MTTGRPARQPAGGSTDTGETALPSGVSLRVITAAPPTGGTPSPATAPTGDMPTAAMMVGDGGFGGGVMAAAVAAAREGVSSCCRQ